MYVGVSEATYRRPSDHAANIALGLDILTDAIVTGTLLDERVLSLISTC